MQDIKSTHRNQLCFYTLITEYLKGNNTIYNSIIKKKKLLYVNSNNKTGINTIKYLGIKLTKDAKGLYTEISKILMHQLEEDINKWKCI